MREGSDVSLRCVANGSPEPEITWRREDNQEISIDKKKGEKNKVLVKMKLYFNWDLIDSIDLWQK